jgi:hypothetical protein
MDLIRAQIEGEAGRGALVVKPELVVRASTAPRPRLS